jgi:YHS domain-containing protein
MRSFRETSNAHYTPIDVQPMSSQRAKDPICGMMVDPNMAIKVVVEGNTYYACSERCALQIKSKKSKR